MIKIAWPRVASHFRMRHTSRHRPRDFGGLGSSELIARLGGWHLEGPGRAYLMPGINRATAARGFPGLRSFGDTALPQGAGAGLHLAIPPTALAMYVPTTCGRADPPLRAYGQKWIIR